MELFVRRWVGLVFEKNGFPLWFGSLDCMGSLLKCAMGDFMNHDGQLWLKWLKKSGSQTFSHATDSSQLHRWLRAGGWQARALLCDWGVPRGQLHSHASTFARGLPRAVQSFFVASWEAVRWNTRVLQCCGVSWCDGSNPSSAVFLGGPPGCPPAPGRSFSFAFMLVCALAIPCRTSPIVYGMLAHNVSEGTTAAYC